MAPFLLISIQFIINNEDNHSKKRLEIIKIINKNKKKSNIPIRQNDHIVS